jgi:hypothetical protein
VDEALKVVEEKWVEVKSHQGKRVGSHTTAISTASIDGLVYGALTGGACLVVFRSSALVAWRNGVNENAERLSEQERMDNLQSYYEEAEQRVLGKFEQGVFEEINP